MLKSQLNIIRSKLFFQNIAYFVYIYIRKPFVEKYWMSKRIIFYREKERKKIHNKIKIKQRKRKKKQNIK